MPAGFFVGRNGAGAGRILVYGARLSQPRSVSKLSPPHADSPILHLK